MIDLNRVRSDPAGVAAALAKRGTQVDFAGLLEWHHATTSPWPTNSG